MRGTSEGITTPQIMAVSAICSAALAWDDADMGHGGNSPTIFYAGIRLRKSCAR